VRPVLSYVCATWAITKADKEKFLREEILWKMHSPIYSPEQKWKIRSNNQFKVLYKRENMVEIVRRTRIE